MKKLPQNRRNGGKTGRFYIVPIFTRDNTFDSPKDCYKCLLKIILLFLNKILVFHIEVRVSDANRSK